MINTFKYQMLLVLPVPLRRIDNKLYVELQAHHGIRRWLDSFESLIVAAAVMPEWLAQKQPEISWVPVNDLPTNVRLVELPWAYRIDHFFRSLLKTRVLLARLIDESRYLQFAVGGLWGDWAAVGALIAHKKQRLYSIHTDRVEHDVILLATKNSKLTRKLRVGFESFLMEKLHKQLISNCDLGLFHGMDTWTAYYGWMRHHGESKLAFCIHDIHDEGLLTQDSVAVSTPCKTVLIDNVVSIFYAGRFVSDKAPLHWLGVLNRLYKAGIQFHAVWAGDGPVRGEFELQLKEFGLQALIDTPGFVEDRSQVAAYYRSADIFLFTHVTPESPRCLLEALRLGVPIVGYDSAFARDLVSVHGGGVLVPCGDQAALAETVRALIDCPAQLNQLKNRALQDGARFTSKAVFEERSRLIKAYT